MKPVDCHCHLDFDRFDSDREEVLDRCREELEFVVNAGRDPESNRASLELRRENPELVEANLGLHPTRVEKFGKLEKAKHQIKDHRPSAVGEIGLDHHHVTGEEKRERQLEVFRSMLELAEELGLPVVVHSRDAEKEAFETLRKYEIPEIMLHSFNGTPELAENAVEEGMKIGVNTQVLYSNRVREIVKRIEIDDILLETDSPFLYQGERNEPVNVRESAGRIAEIKNIDVERVVEPTSRNAREIFR